MGVRAERKPRRAAAVYAAAAGKEELQLKGRQVSSGDANAWRSTDQSGCWPGCLSALVI